ncbi:MBL fold metallo-hydrolase [Massilia violaceinigra]|uniref:MBL fold metallo-hydrolase n=1 Tax=Massilia violaceinigra TaxID=2045208 RepID=A0ABY4A7G0_9BURK|nr:MBL fold metallo-hydrolase [Massilia violaceinigra]UOD30090.1 MBL fold metallo-hydrolase [Massilia violaceinigra]
MNNTVLAGALAAAFLTFAAAAPAAWSQAAASTRINKVQPGYHHVKVGDVNVIALSDGTLAIPPGALLTNVAPAQVAARLAATFQGTHVDASVNAYLIESGERLLLVDTGSGELYGPTLNKLVATLHAAGYQPEQITDILVTHIHTDHTGGLMDGKRMVFPNATVHLDQRELDYWMSAARRSEAPESRRALFDQALKKVKPYLDAGKVKTFDGATQLFPGIRSIPSYGHTPGHSLYALESGGQKLVFWGDLLHVAEVQMPDPSVTIVFDVDAKAAAAQRKRAFADAAAGKYLVAGDHIAFPGVGRLRAEGDGYRWVPMPYINDHVVPAPR